MKSPNRNTPETRGLRFKDDEVSDTAFMSSGAIINGQNITGICICHDFQKDIHTSGMSNRQYAPGNFPPRNQGVDPDRRNPHKNA